MPNRKAPYSRTYTRCRHGIQHYGSNRVTVDIARFQPQGMRCARVEKVVPRFEDRRDITMFADNVDDPAVRRRIEYAACTAHCEEFIARLADGYDAMMGERGVNLSGGQKQRIAIAREIYKDAPLMILDEATSALDTDSERAIQDSIEHMHGERTIVIVAHRLSTVRNCDKIFVLSRGRIIESGTFDSLTQDSSSRFHALVDAQRL